MLPESVSTNVTTDRGSRSFLGVEIIYKITVQERGDRGIEFNRRNHSQIGPRDTATLEEFTRGYRF